MEPSSMLDDLAAMAIDARPGDIIADGARRLALCVFTVYSLCFLPVIYISFGFSQTFLFFTIFKKNYTS